MITAASLRSYTCKDLSEMAKTQGVEGWYSMRKEELIRALVNKARAKARRAKRQASSTREATAKRQVSRGRQSKRVVTASRNGKAGSRAKHPATDNQGAHGSNGRSQKRDRREAVVTSRPKSRKVLEQIQKANERRDRLRDLSCSAVGPPAKNGNGKRETNGTRKSATRDRVVLLVRDSYWLHAVWEIRRQTVERVKAALAEHWHTARPILRLIEVDGGATTGTAERVEREIDIHGGVNNWYIDVHEPPKHYRVAIGYLAADGRFHALARSNSVTTPPPGSSDSLDENWREVAKDYEHVYAMSGGYRDEPASGDLRELFEERLRRPMGVPLVAKFGVRTETAADRRSEFALEVDAELIIFGQTKPDANVTLAGEPLKLRPDGTFTVRRSLPDRRQVLPVVSSSANGLEQRTIILAIERNTKVMEPLTRDSAVS